MIVSTKGRYALRVMIDLAEHQAEKYVPLKEVAARQEISEKYLENILKVLVHTTNCVDNMQIDHLREWFLNLFFHEVLIHGDLWNGCVFGDICF